MIILQLAIPVLEPQSRAIILFWKNFTTHEFTFAKSLLGLVENHHIPAGYDIGMNCGEVAGQTVMHFHFHVIPRYEGEMDDPRCGVRHLVAEKGYYE